MCINQKMHNICIYCYMWSILGEDKDTLCVRRSWSVVPICKHLSVNPFSVVPAGACSHVRIELKVLNERRRVHDVSVGIQCGKEPHIPVLVHPQFGQSLFQLIRISAAWVLEVWFFQHALP